MPANCFMCSIPYIKQNFNYMFIVLTTTISSQTPSVAGSLRFFPIRQNPLSVLCGDAETLNLPPNLQSLRMNTQTSLGITLLISFITCCSSRFFEYHMSQQERRVPR